MPHFEHDYLVWWIYQLPFILIVLLFQQALCLTPDKGFHSKEWFLQKGMHTPSALAHDTDEKNQALKLLFVTANVDLVLQLDL